MEKLKLHFRKFKLINHDAKIVVQKLVVVIISKSLMKFFICNLKIYLDNYFLFQNYPLNKIHIYLLYNFLYTLSKIYFRFFYIQKYIFRH